MIPSTMDMPSNYDKAVSCFTYHAPKTPEQLERYKKVRELTLEFAIAVLDLTPESHEQSLFLTELDKALYFGLAAIARNE